MIIEERGFFTERGSCAWSLESDHESGCDGLWLEINGQVMVFSKTDYPHLRNFAETILKAIDNA